MPINPSFTGSQYKEYLGDFKDEFTKVLSTLEEADFPKRIQNKDYTLWSNSPDEIENRLGWLNLPDSKGEELGRINNYSNYVLENSYSSVLLLGMGGSSLAPEMFAKGFSDLNPLNISVLDSTDPEYISSVRAGLDLKKTVVIVSSKSGSTVETASLLNYFLEEYSNIMDIEELGKHFSAITDPGSGLEEISRELKFSHIFLNDPEIGGRFSALSYFGLVPASLTGIDLAKFIERAHSSAALCMNNDININTGLRLGAFMGFLAEKGVDKLSIFTSDEISGLKSWIEQLVAESTGKSGKGILPVPENSTDLNYSKDRSFVYIKLKNDEKAEREINEILMTGRPLVVLEPEDRYDLARQIFFWEYATAAAGHIMQLNPFDQPDVESAKIYTRDFVEEYKKTGILGKEKPRFSYEHIKFYSASPIKSLDSFCSWIEEKGVEGSYISFQVFLPPDKNTELKLLVLAKKLAPGSGLPVTIGFGPRYLHSSGQLHKGDGGKGIFIQVTSDSSSDLAIPDGPLSKTSSLSFGILKNAQALGDYGVLKDMGRNIVSIELGSDIDADLNKLIDLL